MADKALKCLAGYPAREAAVTARIVAKQLTGSNWDRIFAVANNGGTFAHQYPATKNHE